MSEMAHQRLFQIHTNKILEMLSCEEPPAIVGVTNQQVMLDLNWEQTSERQKQVKADTLLFRTPSGLSQPVTGCK